MIALRAIALIGAAFGATAFLVVAKIWAVLLNSPSGTSVTSRLIVVSLTLYALICTIGAFQLLANRHLIAGATRKTPICVRAFLMVVIQTLTLAATIALTHVFGWSYIHVSIYAVTGTVYSFWAWRLIRDTELAGHAMSIPHEARTVWVAQMQVLIPFLCGALTETVTTALCPEWTPVVSDLSAYGTAGAVVQVWGFFQVRQEVNRQQFQRWTDNARRLIAIIFVPWLVLFVVLAVSAEWNRPESIAWTVAGIAAFSVHWLIYHAVCARPAVIAGRDLVPFIVAKRKADRLRPKKDRGWFFGGLQLAVEYAKNHTAFIGTTRSGKTTAFRLIMMDVLPFVGTGCDWRAVIYDAKQDGYSQIAGIPLNSVVMNMNPSDKRSWKWRICRDILHFAAAIDAAKILYHDRADTNPFFVRQAQKIGGRVMYGFVLWRREKLAAFRATKKAEGISVSDEELEKTLEWEWTFEDYIRVMRDPDLICEFLNRWPETRGALKTLRVQEVRDNVFATIASYIEEYEVIAGLWSHVPPERSISFTEWAEDPKGGIILLQRSHEATEPTDSVIRLMFQRISKALLNLPSSSTRRTWTFLDELNEAKPFDGLQALALQGAANGISLVLGIHSIGSLRAKDKYGADADAILGMCSSKGIFRLDEPETQKWASEVIGRKRYYDPIVTYTPNGTSVNYPKAGDYIVEPTDWAALPMADFEDNGITNWYVSPVTGVFKQTLPGGFLRERFRPSTDRIVDVDKRPASDQDLREWTPEEREHFGFAPAAPILTAVEGGAPGVAGTQKRPRRPKKSGEDLRLLSSDNGIVPPEWLRELNKNAGQA